MKQHIPAPTHRRLRGLRSQGAPGKGAEEPLFHLGTSPSVSFVTGRQPQNRPDRVKGLTNIELVMRGLVVQLAPETPELKYEQAHGYGSTR